MTSFTIRSTKGTLEIEGTLAEAVAAAIAHEEEHQPPFGVEITCGDTDEGEPLVLAEVRDGVVDYAGSPDPYDLDDFTGSWPTDDGAEGSTGVQS